MDNLQTALTLPISHLSAYSLILERGTILNKMVLDGKVSIQDDDYDAELYELTIDFFESNKFKQYEVSNFAMDGFECLHNKAYWNYQGYLGFGPSAHSFVGGMLGILVLKYIMKLTSIINNKLVTRFSFEEMLNEYVMLAIRSNGLFINDFITRFGRLINKSLITSGNSAKTLLMDDHSIRLTKSGYVMMKY
jgi:oxygen-independent coproporphyrinogen-3 oxidase